MNKAAAIAVSSVMLITVMVTVLFGLLSSPNQASAAPAPIVNCQVVAGTDTAKVICSAAGVVVLNTTLNLPVITLPPIQLPGSTETVTVTLPPQPAGPKPTVTKTVEVPVEGPTNTVTVTAPPTNSPQPTGPTKTVTQKAGQPKTKYVTISPEPTPEAQPPQDKGGVFPPVGPVGKTVIGVLSLIALVAIVLFAMYSGYYIGYKDSDKENVRFLRALRDNIASRKQ